MSAFGHYATKDDLTMLSCKLKDISKNFYTSVKDIVMLNPWQHPMTPCAEFLINLQPKKQRIFVLELSSQEIYKLPRFPLLKRFLKRFLQN